VIKGWEGKWDELEEIDLLLDMGMEENDGETFKEVAQRLTSAVEAFRRSWPACLPTTATKNFAP